MSLREEARLDLGGESVRRHVARGTIVNGAFLVGLYSLGLLRGFIVAGLLGARAYGVWGIVLITFSTLLWLKQVGVVDRYVQQDEPDQEVAFQRAFTVEVVVTAAFVAVMLAAVPLVATVYGHAELVGPSLVFIAAVAISTLQTPIWIHYRRMSFVRQRALQAIDPILGFAVTIGLAVAGAGYWSLVAGVAVGALASGVAATATSPYPLRLRFERHVLGDYLGFSWPLFVASASSLVVAQSTILAGEKLEGVAAVGVIVLAASIANYANRVDEVVTQTVYPAICAVGDRIDLLFETFSKSNRLALMWGLPFGIGVALFGSDIVRFGIGDQWRSGVGLIEAFGAIAGISHIGFNWDAFYRARGETRPIAIWSFLCMLTFVTVAIPLLAVDGLDGLAIGMGAMAAVSLALRLYYLGRLFPAFDIARHVLRAVAPTVPAAATILAVRLALGYDRTVGRAVAELALYLALTAAFTVRLERDLLREVLGYLRRDPGRPGSAPAGARAAT